MNIRFDNESVRVRVSHPEALRLLAEGGLGEFWLTVQTRDLEVMALERHGDGFLFWVSKHKLVDMLNSKKLGLVQEGPMKLLFEIDRFTTPAMLNNLS